MKSLIRSFIVLASILILVACSKLSGTYTSVSPAGAEGMMAIEFLSGSNAILKINGVKTEVNYSVDGKNLKLVANGNNQVFEIQDDGTITTGSAVLGTIILKKQ